MLPSPALINPLYAALLAVGGIIGYVKANSKPSVISGAGCGLIVFLCTILSVPFASLIVAAISGLMLYIMGTRYIHTKSNVAGIVAATSILTLLSQLSHILSTGSFTK
ncbi:unnamed protein product [Cylicocyclus nassatus]|uniref:Transmembrane protein 14C n=1 Tax=Cylicocyclus nassatus TaxID=53992 RepID=A0AA36GNI1_CYLNA|nr:unnamed protein product [Cylicocyclus nassatus]